MRLLHLVDIDSDINYTFHWWVSFVCGNSAACLLFKFAVNLRFLEPTEKVRQMDKFTKTTRIIRI